MRWKHLGVEDVGGGAGTACVCHASGSKENPFLPETESSNPFASNVGIEAAVESGPRSTYAHARSAQLLLY